MHASGWLWRPWRAGREDEPGVADAVDALRADGATVVLALSFADPDATPWTTTARSSSP